MIEKILIANRGEIACRIIKTAGRLGIHTVAVYSEADSNARHVRMADEAVCIGPAAPLASYLAADAIIGAAMLTGVQAIHPGYGFLSENADFAELCTDKGLIFIGPPSSAIRAMGSKSAAKALMEKAGVPLMPGYHGGNQDEAFLQARADDIGYPVLIKACVGGGGKGMRLVEKPDDFPAALSSCRREAQSAFGDSRVLVERYITRPRHIEIQIFFDSLGNGVYLFERDCSVQRRHQKVLEEAPAPGMTETRRREMGEAAVTAAKAVGYVGAGTVEFIAEQSGRFYFMEMNTRLQVEHPVTEMVTGLDLVEWQLRVASGEPLPLSQDQLQLTGHALEARIYAEDPSRGFLPSTGRFLHLAPPQESRNVRVDSGVEEGDDITPFYDPMIAKLIVWDKDREGALNRMRRALSEYRVVGVTTNISFLSLLIDCPAFTSADLDTGLIERSSASLFPETVAAPLVALQLAAVGELLLQQEQLIREKTGSSDPWSPWNESDGWMLNLKSQRTIRFRTGGKPAEVQVSYLADGWLLICGGRKVVARGHLLENNRISVEIDNHRFLARIIATGSRRHIFCNSQSWLIERDDPLQLVEAGGVHSGGLTAPMPGKIIALLATPGIKVDKGTPLLILEAMKMEHTITAPADGMVISFACDTGDQVPEGTELVDFQVEEK